MLAKKYFKTLHNRNCILGQVTGKNVIFAIDVSYSMQFNFTLFDGT